jgi:hypothetical protein
MFCAHCLGFVQSVEPVICTRFWKRERFHISVPPCVLETPKNNRKEIAHDILVSTTLICSIFRSDKYLAVYARGMRRNHAGLYVKRQFLLSDVT